MLRDWWVSHAVSLFRSRWGVFTAAWREPFNVRWRQWAQQRFHECFDTTSNYMSLFNYYSESDWETHANSKLPILVRWCDSGTRGCHARSHRKHSVPKRGRLQQVQVDRMTAICHSMPLLPLPLAMRNTDFGSVSTTRRWILLSVTVESFYADKPRIFTR